MASYECCGQTWSARGLLNHADARHPGPLTGVALKASLDVMVEDGDAERTDGRVRLTEQGLRRAAALVKKLATKGQGV